MSHKKWAVLFDTFVKSKKDTNYVTIPAGRKGYAGETVETSVMFPVRQATFEGLTVNIPSNIHRYLQNLYGDYMVIPPEKKRERHYVVDIKI